MKRIGKTILKILSSGDRLWKGKVLSPFPSVVIYGLLVASSHLKIPFGVNVFENILKRRLSAANFVMFLVSARTYTKCFLSLKMFRKKSLCMCEKLFCLLF